MNEKEFMDQKAKDMSVEELANAIKIKTKEGVFINDEIIIQEEDSIIIGIKILSGKHRKNPFSYPVIQIKGMILGDESTVIIARSIPTLKKAIKKLEKITEELK